MYYSSMYYSVMHNIILSFDIGGTKMKKHFVLFGVICMLCLFPSITFATPISIENETTEPTITLEEALTYIEEIAEDDFLDLGLIRIKKGFSKLEEPTFSEQRNLSLEGEEGVEVVVFVYCKDKDGKDKVTFETPIQVIGASGMYHEIIPIDTIGENYIVIYAQKGEQKIARQFQLNRKNQETKVELENKRYTILKMIP